MLNNPESINFTYKTSNCVLDDLVLKFNSVASFLDGESQSYRRWEVLERYVKVRLFLVLIHCWGKPSHQHVKLQDFGALHFLLKKEMSEFKKNYVPFC